MGNWQLFRYHSGRSLLGGAACGLSYEGALRDALAAEEREWRRQAGQFREAPPRAEVSQRQPKQPERR